jgi:hypothetical protein
LTYLLIDDCPDHRAEFSIFNHKSPINNESTIKDREIDNDIHIDTPHAAVADDDAGSRCIGGVWPDASELDTVGWVGPELHVGLEGAGVDLACGWAQAALDTQSR